MTTHRVLIADDDCELAYALASRCQKLGLAVDTASTAMQALSQLESRPPDLAILDVEMPEGSGLAVCEMALHNDVMKNIPVIIMTGKKDPSTIQRCHELRAFYVTKCADVWPRIRPLLEDLLELPKEARPTPESPIPSEEAWDANEPPRSPATEMMDAVFDALGYDDSYFGADDKHPSERPAPRPWVLCIDDDASFSFGLQLRLQERGVDVLRAFAGREGYRTAFHSCAQAIILDYELPEGNGDYVLRRLKENSVTRDIPVIVLTGHQDRHVERQMFSLGAAAFLTKPYDWEDLWRELFRHLKFAPNASQEAVATSVVESERHSVN